MTQPDSAAVGMHDDGMEADPALRSDYHPADTSAGGGTSEAVDSQAVQDPDLVIVAGEVVEDDADPDATDTGDTAEANLAGDSLADGDLDESDVDSEVAPIASSPASADMDRDDGQAPDLGQQWHDIQALFVDDPRGSVELAAAAADAAVTALVDRLHQRQSALAQTGSTSADPGGTEQLREALRSYRIFSQNLTEIGQRLAQPAGTTG
jgi:hypothetical protein